LWWALYCSSTPCRIAGPGGQRVLDQVVRDRNEPAELVVNLVVITAPLWQRTRRRS
jgi:hypothetical protein